MGRARTRGADPSGDAVWLDPSSDSRRRVLATADGGSPPGTGASGSPRTLTWAVAAVGLGSRAIS
jgi:hypothetical protein